MDKELMDKELMDKELVGKELIDKELVWIKKLAPTSTSFILINLE